MTHEELNKLKVGEKAVDIQEYYWGENGKILAYKVIIYTCIKYLLFFKKIKEFTFPFYFVSKEFALEFLKVYEKYNFKYVKFYDSDIYTYGEDYDYYDGILMFSKNIQNQKFNYKLISAYNKISTPVTMYDTLHINGIWSGLVSSSDINKLCYRKLDCYHYSYIEEKEKLAAKEGTIGKTYSFKMIEEK